MELAGLVIAIVVGGACGFSLAAAWMRSRLEAQLRAAEMQRAAAVAEAAALRLQLEAGAAALAELRTRFEQATAARAALEARAEEQSRRSAEHQRLLAEVEQKFGDSFRALAAAALKANNDSFLTLANERFAALQQQSGGELEARRVAIGNLLEPMKDILGSLDRELRRIETERRSATEILTGQLQSLSSQTTRLVDALKTPTVRGRWGEIQLRRVVEIAGMIEHCDFEEQSGLSTADGRLRPDMTVHLPGGRTVVVDAKVPLQAYMAALEAQDEAERLARLRDHARQLRSHVGQLSAKAYWEALERAPEFVVLFLAGEMFFSAALQQDPELIEDAAAARVILATPTTMIALLKAVAYGWRQERLAENAERISRLGQDLYDRIMIMRDHLVKVGASLAPAVRSFNDAVGSFQSRVIPAARRFRELGIGGKDEIREIEPVDILPREVVTPPLATTACASKNAATLPDDQLPLAGVLPGI